MTRVVKKVVIITRAIVPASKVVLKALRLMGVGGVVGCGGGSGAGVVVMDEFRFTY